MYTVVGKEYFEGVYNGKPYSNTKFYLTLVKGSSTLQGVRVEQVKIRDDGSLYNSIDIGSVVKLFYNKYGNLVEIETDDPV